MVQLLLTVLLLTILCNSSAEIVVHKYQSTKSCELQNATTTTSARSLLDCIRQCSRYVNCSAVTFSEDTKTCALFTHEHCIQGSAANSVSFVRKQSFTTTTAPTTTPTTTTTTEEPIITTTEEPIITTTEEPIITTPMTCLNNGTLIESSQTCQCYGGYIGDNCEHIMKDCKEGYRSGHYENDVYGAYLIKPDLAPTAFTVQCSMKEYGGGTMIMKNTEWTTNPNLNMNRNWADYKNGFGGSVMENHWIGLQNIYYITSSRPQHLYIQIIAKTGNYKGGWRKYEHFAVEDEATNYRMTYYGSFPWSQTEADADNDWTNLIENVPLGDSMLGLNGSAFSTYDQDNDLDPSRNCALDYEGGWWHNACANCNPTGPRRSPRTSSAVNEVFWKNDYIDNEIAFVEMMLRAV